MATTPTVTTAPAAAQNTDTALNSNSCFGNKCGPVVEECRARLSGETKESRDFACVDLTTSTPTISAEQYVNIANNDLANLIPEADRDKFTRLKYNAGTNSVITDSMNLKVDNIKAEGVRLAIRPSTYVTSIDNESEYTYRPEHGERPIEISVQNGKDVNIFKHDPVPAHIEYVSREDFPKRIGEIVEMLRQPSVPNAFFDKLITVNDGVQTVTPRN